MKILLFSISVFVATTSLAQKNCNQPLNSVFITNHDTLIKFADSLAVQLLQTKTREKDIPRFIRKTIKCWSGEFRIADIGKPFNPTDVVWNNIPQQRIKFLALNNTYLILAFEQGGKAKTDHLMLFNFKNKKIKMFWSGYDYIFSEIAKENIMEHIHYAIKHK